jgi:hypothetical protein
MSLQESLSGYLSPQYAESLDEFGTPYEIPNCQGWVLKRKISGTEYHDAMCPYPLFFCKNWKDLHIGIDNVKNDLVTISLVTDPFGDYDPSYLRDCFNDVVFPFKEHFVTDLTVSPDKFISSHHKRYIRKAESSLCVERCDRPLEFIDAWMSLYTNLINRHDIRGIRTFSKRSFIKQLSVPGVVMFRAVHDGATVGILLWYVQNQIGYYHLGAYSDVGYELRASFILFDHAIKYFASHNVRWLSLGAGAGIKNDTTDGLSRFKAGWATGTRTAYFCGRILNHEAYREILRLKNLPQTKYFPAYREGEFT